MSTTTTDEWLNAEDAAKLLGVSRHTLFRLRSAGKIPFRQVPGAHPRFRRADLERLAAAADHGAAPAREGEVARG